MASENSKWLWPCFQIGFLGLTLCAFFFGIGGCSDNPIDEDDGESLSTESDENGPRQCPDRDYAMLQSRQFKLSGLEWALQSVTNYEYDAKGRLASKCLTNPGGALNCRQYTYYFYDEMGRLSVYVEGSWGLNRYVESRHLLTYVEGVLKSHIVFNNSDGPGLWDEDIGDYYCYDELGRLDKTIRGGASQWTDDSCQAQGWPDGIYGVVLYFYDESGKLYKSFTSDLWGSDSFVYEYRNDDRLERYYSEDRYSYRGYFYDEQDRVARVESLIDNTEFIYDQSNRVIAKYQEYPAGLEKYKYEYSWIDGLAMLQTLDDNEPLMNESLEVYGVGEINRYRLEGQFECP